MQNFISPNRNGYDITKEFNKKKSGKSALKVPKVKKPQVKNKKIKSSKLSPMASGYDSRAK